MTASIAPTLNVHVVRRTQEATDIVSFELQCPLGNTLPAFTPGAHIDVHLPQGVIRQYSLCNASVETQRYTIAVLRDPASRGGSSSLHDHIREGAELKISQPRNHFPLHEGPGHSLLMAGGIGVTPLMCMADALHGKKRSFALHYCARTSDRMAFVQQLSEADWSTQVHTHFDDGLPEQRLDISATLRAASDDTHLYVCGPQGFMQAVLSCARELGWPQTRLHSEYFQAAERPDEDAADRPFEVEIASSGAVFTIDVGQSIAEVLNAHGHAVSMSCEQGVCGTCVTRVLAGEPDHRDSFLLPEERSANDQMTPCCSRARSARLVLDL